jgi:glycosyltransferase involved in cell wall biosynthesis
MAAPDHPPTVSVLLPVFNAERFLPAALASILAQTFTDWELIAVDDGSTDSSPRILQEYAARDSRLRVLRPGKIGFARSLNQAIAAARGCFIARMDADDLSMPRRLAIQVDYLDRHPDCVLVGSQVTVIDDVGDPIGPFKGLPLEHDQIDSALMKLAWPLVHPSVMMRREAILAAGGYAEGLFPVEDHDLFLKMCEIGRVANLPDTLLCYRRHDTASTWGLPPREKTLEALRAACGRRGLPFSPPPEGPPPRQILSVIWAWHALAAGHRRTARKYAWKSLRARPLDPECWKLLLCVLRGH